MTVRRLLRWFGLALLSLVILLIGGWCALVVWFRFPASEWVRGSLAVAFLLLALAAAVSLATSRRWIAFGADACLFAVVLAWWTTMMPSNDREWTPDVAQSVTGTIEGDWLTLNNVRNFWWRSD